MLFHKYFYVIVIASFALAFATLAHDIPGFPTENQAWYQNAETNESSTPRTSWVKCCNHAEVIDAKFIIRPGTF
jgi:hypothetical protein